MIEKLRQQLEVESSANMIAELMLQRGCSRDEAQESIRVAAHTVSMRLMKEAEERREQVAKSLSGTANSIVAAELRRLAIEAGIDPSLVCVPCHR
ncbi:hypothetical protein [Mariprofundus sp. KV]|uniref:hypothetical protein n=1 Tax=Mariprofundus sp. KV TaxID=2608715 RepID=UPI0015A226FD|nr:hypothetical protein [Mariprofundus sp. KV]NWF37271.1 hypothetical protein [Mariprofundus sp. KV]